MSITSSTQLISCIPHSAACRETEPSPLKLPHYMSGPHAELFAQLICRGIITSDGKITPEYAHVSLPPLTKSEVSSLREELNREFAINLDNTETLTLSVGTLLEAFQKTLPEQDNSIYVRSLNLIGGYATHILFSRTDYVKRVFDRFGLSELFVPDLIRKQEGKPADVDLRMHIERRPPSPTTKSTYPLIIEGNEFDQMRASIIDILARMALQQNSLVSDRKNPSSSDLPENRDAKRADLTLYARKKIEQHAFSALCKVDTGFNRMLVVSLRSTPVDWIIYHVLGRLCVFTVDDLYIPCEEINDRPSAPESHNGKPLESFLHCILGFIDCEKPETIDATGWFRFISCLVKGYSSIQPGLEEKLFKKVNLSQQDLNGQIEGWLKKHHPDNPLARLIYVLNCALTLKNRLKSDAITDLLTVQLSSTCFTDKQTFAEALQKALLNPNIPFNITTSLLKFGSYLTYVRSAPTHPDITFSIGTDNLEHPIIQLYIGCNSIQLDLKIADELKAFAAFYANGEVDTDLITLFFLLCPPSENLEIRQEEVALDLSGISHIFCSHPSPFIRYLGFLLSASTSLPSARTIADRNLLQFLNLCSNKDDISSQIVSEKSTLAAMRNQLARVSGTPPELDSDFMSNWILTLFEPGRESMEIGYAVWKESNPSLTFSLSLIKRFASSNPDYAIRMLTLLAQTRQNIEQESLDTYCALFETEEGSPLLRMRFEEVLSSFKQTVLCNYIQRQIKQNATTRACFLLKLAREKRLLNPKDEIELLVPLLTKQFDPVLFERLRELSDDDALLSRVYPFPDGSMLEAPIFQACAEGRIKISKQDADFHLSLCRHSPQAWRTIFPHISTLKETPALIELKSAIVDHAVEEREFEKAFYLLSSLFPHFENREHYYDLLTTVLLNGKLNPKKVFGLLSQIAKVDKNACYSSLFRAIQALIFQHPEELSRWLKETDFFNSLEERAELQSLLRNLCLYLLRENVAKAGYYCLSLIKKYSQDLQDLEIITTLITENYLSTKEKFALLDLLNPELAKTELGKVVALFGIKMVENKEGCKRWTEWLLTTSFFSALPQVATLMAETEDVIADEQAFLSSLEETLQARQNLKTVVQSTFYSLILFSKNEDKEWAPFSFKFLSNYLDDLRPISQDEVQAFFALIDHAEDFLLTLAVFLFIEEKQLQPETSNDFICNYASIINDLETDPIVIPLLQNRSRLNRFASCLESQCEANFLANFYWLKAVFYWANHDNRDIASPRAIKQAYERIQLALRQIRLPETKRERPLGVYSYREGMIDFLYLTYLYSHEDPQQNAEGKELFREKIRKLHPKEYWFTSEIFYNYLIRNHNPELQFEIDSLLEVVETVYLDKQACADLLQFLIQNPSPGRLIKASTIWMESVETNKIPFDQHSWEFGYRIADEFFNFPKESDLSHPLNTAILQHLEIINTIYREYYAQFRENTLYNIQIREINLRYSMRQSEDKDNQKLIIQTLEGFFTQLGEFYADRNSCKALAIMPEAIAAVASFNPPQFCLFAEKYWISLTEIPMKDIQYSIGYVFIEILIANKDRSPEVKEQARIYLNHLMRDHREKSDAIRVLIERLHADH